MMRLERTVRRMVFCNYISNTDCTVTYAFGASSKDVTGQFVFDFVNGQLEIVREPDTEMAPIRHIHKLLRMQQAHFRAHTFKDKLSYESA